MIMLPLPHFRRAILAATLILAGSSSPASLSGPGPDRLAPPAETDLPPVIRAMKAGGAKLDAALIRYLDIERDRGAEAAAAFARTRRIVARDGAVRVVVESASEPAGMLSAAPLRLAGRIASLGGRIEVRHRGLLQAFIPTSSLGSLAVDPLVTRVRLPRRPMKMDVVSEGVRKTGANAWASLPAYRSAGAAKIAILDVGFKGYSSLLGSELPSTIKTRSFRADGDLEAGEDHGTACAEIVHDMAPDAELWLINFETDVEEHAALNWLVKQGIQVISYSLGWYNAGAGNGTGPIGEDVAFAAANGILWASAAGNGAMDHWDGNFVDTDGDGNHEFAPGDEILSFRVPAGTEVGAFLNWKDWGTWTGLDYTGTDQDYDLYLHIWNGSSWELVDYSEGDQDGGDWPIEEIFGWSADEDATWGVQIVRYRGTKDVRLELFAYGNMEAIEHVVPERSIIIPADSPGAVAVGASDALNDGYHSYSSRGPTWDGRLKPDLAAPSGVSTSTGGPSGFWGTSASTPHLAGAFGLFRGLTPYTPDQIQKILEKKAVDLGEPGPDNRFGSGRLNLK